MTDPSSTGAATVVLGLDAGTTACKAVAMTAAGEIIASQSSLTIVTTAPSPGGSEQVPDEIWRAMVSAIRGVVQQLPNDTLIVGISMAAQSGSVIPMGSDNRPTGSVVTWMDTRSLNVIASWTEEQRTAIRTISGWSLSPGLGLATITWLHSQFDAQSATHFRSVDDYLLHRLTGEWMTNPSNASGMQFMDANSLEWSADLCDLAMITPGQLSTITSTGSVAGGITDSAAKYTGLEPGTPVIIGGHDQACATLGLGAADLTSLVLAAGTAWVVTAIIDHGDIDRLPPNFNLSPSFVADRWSVSRNLGGFGAIINWMLDFWPESPELLEQRLAKSVPNLEDPYFLPALHEEDRFNWGRFVHADTGGPSAASAKPANIMPANIMPANIMPANIMPANIMPEGWSPYEQARAVLESCAFEARRATDIARTVSPSITGLTVVGGCTQSDYLVGLMADVTAIPLTIKPDASWPAIGAARIAADGIGWPAASHHESFARTISPSTPNPILDQRFETYCRLTSGAPS